MADPILRIPLNAYGGSEFHGPVKAILALKDKFYERADASWVPLGEMVEIARRLVPGGIYVGGRLPTLLTRPVLHEPSLIDPELPVSEPGSQAAGPDDAIRPYRELAPGERAAYLDWLAGGRDVGEATPAQLELYIWGIERRMLVDTFGSVSANEELPGLVSELMRIGDAVTHPGLSERMRSIGYWVRELVNLAAICALEESVTTASPPPLTNSRFAELEFRLGLMAVAGTTGHLDAEWALAWYQRAGVLKPRRNAERFDWEFNELFRKRFNVQYESGVPIGTEGYKFSLWVNVRNPGIPGPLRYFGRDRQILIREVSIPIRTLVDECASALDAYGKYVTDSPEGANSLVAAALLPEELFEVSGFPALARVREFARSVSAGVRDCSVDELLGIPRDPNVGTGEGGDLAVISAILRRLGVGFEPDPLFGGRRPAGYDRLYLFTCATDCDLAPDESFRFADDYLLLAAELVRKNGALDDIAISSLRQVIDSLGLSTIAHAARLKARLDSFRDFPLATREVKVRARRLAKQGHTRIPEQLLQIGRVNGSLGPEGISLLTEIFKIFGLPTEEVFRQVHALGTKKFDQESFAELLRAPVDQGEVRALLDQSELTRKRKESEHVSSLLDDVFLSDDDLDRNEGTSAAVPTAAGLARFFSELGRQRRYSATALAALAEKCDVLGAAALEELNEAAFDLMDEPLWGEDGDGYIVDLDVHMQLAEMNQWGPDS